MAIALSRNTNYHAYNNICSYAYFRKSLTPGVLRGDGHIWPELRIEPGNVSVACLGINTVL